MLKAEKVGPCSFVEGRCTAHGKPRCYDGASTCETGFYDESNWVDVMSDDDHRRNLRSDVRDAIDTLKRALSWQASKIRTKTPEDHADESFIREALVRLSACTKAPEPKPSRARRRR